MRFRIKNHAKVEYEVVAVVLDIVGNTDWEAYDPLVIAAYGKETVTEFAAGDDIVGYALEVEERCLGCR